LVLNADLPQNQVTLFKPFKRFKPFEQFKPQIL